MLTIGREENVTQRGDVFLRLTRLILSTQTRAPVLVVRGVLWKTMLKGKMLGASRDGGVDILTVDPLTIFSATVRVRLRSISHR